MTRGLSPTPSLAAVTDADIARLPPAAQRYLRTAGVVGQPGVANVRVRMHGRIRNDAGSRWMPLRAEQYNFIGRRQRFFYLTSSMFGVPVSGYHRYADASASMHIKLAGLVTVAHVTGSEMFQGETVTFLNDLCLFAPATLLDRALAWNEIDAHTVSVGFTNAGVTVHARLTVNDAGELTDFMSDDRYQLSADGKVSTRRRWSTPVKEYRSFGAVRLFGAGEARWHTETGSFPYIELAVNDVRYNVALIDRADTSGPGHR